MFEAASNLNNQILWKGQSMTFYKHAMRCAAALSCCLLTVQSVSAQDNVLPGLLSAGGVLDNPDPDLVLTIGGGASYKPAYFGSDEYEFGPSGTFRLDFIRFPNGFTFGSGAAVGFIDGLSLLGSSNYVSKRNSSDYSEIDGLDDVDTTLELGFGLGYEKDAYRVFANARYGFFGHEAIVGDVGVDLIARPIQGLTLTAGPRLNWGTGKYADTYFGVSQDEAVASGLTAFSADGGIMRAGVEITALYQFNPRWGVRGVFNWDRLTNDAASSPITKQGSEDQYRIKLELVRRVSINF